MSNLTRAVGTNTPSFHHRCWLSNFALLTTRTVLFFLSTSFQILLPQHLKPTEGFTVVFFLCHVAVCLDLHNVNLLFGSNPFL